MPQLQFFATCPKTIEDLLLRELEDAGAVEMKETVSGVHFSGPLSVAYAVCLRSRFANRILFPLAEFRAATAEELLEETRSIRWDEHLDPSGTFAVEATTTASAINHADYAALVVKDGIADFFRFKYGRRPNVQPRGPDLKVDLHLFRDLATVSIDLSGGSLHRRTYRVRGGAAPIKENVAAAMLARARWPEIATGGGPFVDPMCGSGTLLIEAALMAGEIAPGLLRLMSDDERTSADGMLTAMRRMARSAGLSAGGALLGSDLDLPQRWRGNDGRAWRAAVRAAAEQGVSGCDRIPPIIGFDQDEGAVAATSANISSCGLRSRITVGRRELSRLIAPKGKPGLFAVNPPYGERIGGGEPIEELYRQIGRTLHDRFREWHACILTSEIALSRSVGLRAARTNTLYNGAIRCVLAHFEITEDNRLSARDDRLREGTGRASGGHAVFGTGAGSRSDDVRAAAASNLQNLRTRFKTTGGILAFVNRIRKNRKLLGKWARDNGVTCYRVYDADLPEYAVAVDFFEGQWLHVQEYVAPPEIDVDKTAKRLEDVVTVLPDALGVPPENVFLKRRKRRKRTEQYTKLAASGEFYGVHEGGYSFLVNFTDYLDTGFFLDHRKTRELVRSLANGGRFLNLFAYTCTASVYAAKGGAVSTTSVDSSNAYLRWGRENFTANGIAGQQHRLLRSDCWEWLHVDRDHYDLIFMDPPTFSNAKGKRATLDVQRDHPKLIRLAADRLAPNGVLLFSTNFRRFRMDEEALPDLAIRNITAATIPRDFSRNRRIHVCYHITCRGDVPRQAFP